jgi:hypothetical protein
MERTKNTNKNLMTGEYADGGKLFKKKKLLYSTPASGLDGL